MLEVVVVEDPLSLVDCDIELWSVAEVEAVSLVLPFVNSGDKSFSTQDAPKSAVASAKVASLFLVDGKEAEEEEAEQQKIAE